MDIQTTETTDNSPVVPAITTETTEPLDQSTSPVIAQPETTETSEQSPVPDSNKQTAATSPPQVADPQTDENLEEHAALPDATNTLETKPSDESISPPVTDTQTTETSEQSIVPALESPKTTETLEHSAVISAVTDNSHDNLIASPEHHQGMEMRHETAEQEEEVRSVLKAIAATGKFWYDWERFKNMLSLHLKQVISEYPLTKLTPEEQKVSLGETYDELVRRLDDALHSFVDGPPFTIQRLSEIILDAQSLYPNLSKLALALEKNLSVTSTLTISSDPHSSSPITTPNGLNAVTDDSNPNTQMQSDTVMENGAPPVVTDRDEIMMEVEADVSDVVTMDVETTEKPSESSPMTTDIVGSSGVLVQPMGVSRL
uniref:Serine/threonine-protein phosphatase 4 regulatory subunit 2-like isoform X2 n=1 Tax=Tanacetum cinerariifolium TaxID=118510 RepID=A0A699HRW8_TANCI|nr:serine/threonine-protein phosphatase 4 regulatory subunit 2-like isoform X2 [Tanacetum cinerariifolium]